MIRQTFVVDRDSNGVKSFREFKIFWLVGGGWQTEFSVSPGPGLLSRSRSRNWTGPGTDLWTGPGLDNAEQWYIDQYNNKAYNRQLTQKSVLLSVSG